MLQSKEKAIVSRGLIGSLCSASLFALSRKFIVPESGRRRRRRPRTANDFLSGKKIHFALFPRRLATQRPPQFEDKTERSLMMAPQSSVKFGERERRGVKREELSIESSPKREGQVFSAILRWKPCALGCVWPIRKNVVQAEQNAGQFSPTMIFFKQSSVHNSLF